METFFDPGTYVRESEMYPLEYAAQLFSRQPELDEYMHKRQPSCYDICSMPRLPADELERVIEALTARRADAMATYEFPSGARMSIKDRIVRRTMDRRHMPLGRRQLAKRSLELDKVDHEGLL